MDTPRSAPLWQHQKEAIEFLVSKRAGALFTQPGSGKTRTMCEVIRALCKDKVSYNILIVAPKAVCELEVWQDNITQWASDIAPSLFIHTLYNLPCRKIVDEFKQQSLFTNHLYIINYDKIWRECQNEFIKTHWDIVILDESHKIKSAGSKVSRFFHRLSIKNNIDHKYIMTGTPLYSSPLDIYGQYRFLDDTIFGTNFNKFQEEYCNIDQTLTRICGYTVLNKQNPFRDMAKLQQRIGLRAYVTDNYIDLPDTHHINVHYTPGKTIVSAINGLKQEGYWKDKFGEIATTNSGQKLMKVHQLTSGFCYYTNPEALRQIDNARLYALKGIIEQLQGRPIVVFYRFNYDATQIMYHLMPYLQSEEDSKIAILSGTRHMPPNGVKLLTIQEWIAGECNIILVQGQAGSEGIDLTRACNTIYYSKVLSYGLYEQSIARTHRPGQTNKCTYYHILGTPLDNHIMDSFNQKKDVTTLSFITSKN